MMSKRTLLGAALGAALAVGCWATTPADEARAGVVQGPTFTCARAFPDGPFFLLIAADQTLAQAVGLLGQGYVCIPAAADQASPRFACRFRGLDGAGFLLSEATAILRAGGACRPAGLPASP